MVTQLLRLLTVTQTQDTTYKVVSKPDSRKSIIFSTYPQWFLQNAHFYQDCLTCVTNNLIDHFHQKHYLHFFSIFIQTVFNTHSLKSDSEPDLLSDRAGRLLLEFSTTGNGFLSKATLLRLRLFHSVSS